MARISEALSFLLRFLGRFVSSVFLQSLPSKAAHQAVQFHAQQWQQLIQGRLIVRVPGLQQLHGQCYMNYGDYIFCLIRLTID